MTSWPETRYSLLARLTDADDTAAWQEFQRLYQPAVYRYARSRGLQEADAVEVVQDVMLAVHRAMDQWQPSDRVGSFRAWLAEAARRLTLQIIRQRNKQDRGVGGTSIREVLESIEAAVDGAGNVLDLQRWTFFRAAARVENEVHESTWRAFWLTAVDGRLPKAVAEELGLSVGTVYSAKCRVLARIRHCIDQMSRGEP